MVFDFVKRVHRKMLPARTRLHVGQLVVWTPEGHELENDFILQDLLKQYPDTQQNSCQRPLVLKILPFCPSLAVFQFGDYFAGSKFIRLLLEDDPGVERVPFDPVRYPTALNVIIIDQEMLDRFLRGQFVLWCLRKDREVTLFEDIMQSQGIYRLKRL
jgi:hypothetical protein